MSIVARCLALARRDPDLVVGRPDRPYMRRWHLIPRNRFANIYLHQFLGDDEDRALHDHPWPNCSLLLSGEYHEATFACRPVDGDPLPPIVWRWRRPGRPVLRRAKTAHRIVLDRATGGPQAGEPLPCWSLFLTGPILRRWGFWCPFGRWVHWRSFTAGPKGEVVGAGCGDPGGGRPDPVALHRASHDG